MNVAKKIILTVEKVKDNFKLGKTTFKLKCKIMESVAQ